LRHLGLLRQPGQLLGQGPPRAHRLAAGGQYRAEVGHILSGDPVEERYQGGGYTSIDYSRAAPAPRDAFALD
jgi:hypothetical protein